MEPSIAFNASEESPPLPFPHRETEYSWNRRHDRDHFAERSHNEYSSSTTADDSRSCFLVATTFSFFVALTLSFGLYGTETVHLGPNSSILIKPNHLLVESIKVEEVDVVQGPIVYGFYKDPPLDVEVAWSEIHETTIPGNFHKEWMYYLNEGSQINISYGVKSLSGSSLVLVIAQGEGDLAEWLMDPSYPTTSLSRNIIHGNGSIQKQVAISSYYYIAVGNLDSEFAEVYLNTRIKAVTYNTAEPYYECTPAQGQCRFQLSLLGENVAVITSPGGKSGIVGGGWLVKLTYGPRWLTYLVGIGVSTCLVLLINSLFNHFRCTERAIPAEEFISTGSERNPLLSCRDDSLSSEDSSHVSLSDDEERGEGTHDGTLIKDDEHSQRLCAICFDSPKDSFFLPCGHSMACFACAKSLINVLPTIFEVVTERKSIKDKPGGSLKRSSDGQADTKPEDESNDEEDEGGGDDEHSEMLCGSCSGNYNSDKFWIGCDICKKWYNGKCVKITPAKAEGIKRDKCLACVNRGGL